MRRIFLASIAAVVIGIGAGALYVHEVETAITNMEKVDPGRPLPSHITDQYEGN